MGLIRFGLPRDIVSQLRREFNLSHFVETGTFRGETTSWAASEFASVYTVEASKILFDEVQPRLAKYDNVQCIFGSSEDVLSSIIGQLNGPSLFWLDSHWCGGPTALTHSGCPLLHELELIGQLKFEKYILIDDARYFLEPPPEPFDAAVWPTIAGVVHALEAIMEKPFIAVHDDVIFAVPQHAEHALSSILRQDAPWKKSGTMSDGINWVSSGLRTIARQVRNKLIGAPKY